MFGSHFEIQDGCLSLIKLTNIILRVAAETRAKELDFQFMNFSQMSYHRLFVFFLHADPELV